MYADVVLAGWKRLLLNEEVLLILIAVKLAKESDSGALHVRQLKPWAPTAGVSPKTSSASHILLPTH